MPGWSLESLLGLGSALGLGAYLFYVLARPDRF
jgi:K+-transporting ATPase KdpF subunit